MRKAAFGVIVALGLVACGGKKGSAAGDTTPAPALRAPARRQTNLVTADEIQAQGGSDLGSILRALRPAWFRLKPTRVTGSGIQADPISLYMDGRRIGTASNLGDIPIANVLTVRFYSASEAQGRFGMDNLQGAIEITTTTR